jgi:hypothetical protein
MYYKLDANKNVIPGNMEDSEEIFKNPDKKVVKQENVLDKFVSTVFLPIDHGYPGWSGHTENYKPVVFETMIYDETKYEWLNYQDRYSTWKEAEEGHRRAIEWVKNGCKKNESYE